MVIKAEPWGGDKTDLGMHTSGTHWQNQVGACLMFEVIDLKKDTNNDQDGERAMDK